MVGIVIVSHSMKIATGVKELVEQMTKGYEVFAVGGTADGRLGSNPTAILSAIESADKGDGVVVIADIGSTVMSVGMVKEMIDQKLAARTFLADAPIVEGAISATIEASMGSSVQQVLEAAQSARQIEKIC